MWLAGGGCGWNIWVWLVGVVVRRYIDYLSLLLLYLLFFAAASLFFVHLNFFFVLVIYIISGGFCTAVR